MKNNMVKKLLTLALAGAMTLSLAACGSKSDDSSNDAQQGGDESGKTYKVAMICDSSINDGGWGAACYNAMIAAAEASRGVSGTSGESKSQ